MIKYKCLVLDHDDTLVDSTRTVHFPCFVQYLSEFYPHLADKYTLESYLIKNFHPGVISLFMDEIGMSREQLRAEEEYWANYVLHHIPTAFAGIGELMRDFLREGGIIAVDSHSLKRNIERDFLSNSLPLPNIIYSWDLPEEQRKPSPYTVLDLMERYNLKPSEVLVVDDLKPGYDMARGAGVDFAAAGWAYDIPEIEDFMRRHCDYYLKSVDELRTLLFSKER